MTDLVIRVVLAWALSLPFAIMGVWCAWPVGWILGTLVSVLLYRRWIRRSAPAA